MLTQRCISVKTSNITPERNVVKNFVKALFMTRSEHLNGPETGFWLDKSVDFCLSGAPFCSCSCGQHLQLINSQVALTLRLVINGGSYGHQDQ